MPLPQACGIGAVGVHDLDIVRGAWCARIVDRHDLVELGRGIGIDGDSRRRRDPIGATAHVGNDDLVAEPVHLGEGGSVPNFRSGPRLAPIWRKRREIASAEGARAGAQVMAMQAEDHEQEEDEHDADQETGAGRGRAGEHREAEQAGDGCDDEQDEDPFDHAGASGLDFEDWS